MTHHVGFALYIVQYVCTYSYIIPGFLQPGYQQSHVIAFLYTVAQATAHFMEEVAVVVTQQHMKSCIAIM